MAYREQDEKLTLRVGSGIDEVTVKITCLQGTVATLSFNNKGPRLIKCTDAAKPVGEEGALGGNRRLYSGGGDNPLGKGFKVKHVFTSSVDECTYTFPDDYTGEPDFDKDDETPAYAFVINFITP